MNFRNHHAEEVMAPVLPNYLSFDFVYTLARSDGKYYSI